jgi:hypothetical protein
VGVQIMLEVPVIAYAALNGYMSRIIIFDNWNRYSLFSTDSKSRILSKM